MTILSSLGDTDGCGWLGPFIWGIVASVVAGVLLGVGGRWLVHRRERRRYARMVGDDYVGWGFAGDGGGGAPQQAEWVRNAQSQSTAVVEYQQRNILRLVVSHDGRTWTGQVSMENEHFGFVVWRYTDLPPERESFGLKRIVVDEDATTVKLVLSGESPFGLELFERMKP